MSIRQCLAALALVLCVVGCKTVSRPASSVASSESEIQRCTTPKVPDGYVPLTPTRAQGRLHVVIEGVGDIVNAQYSAAFQSLIAEFCDRLAMRFTFIDRSEFWKGKPEEARIQSTIAKVKAWGAEVLDVSDTRNAAVYDALRPDVVVIATPDFTHVQFARRWLGRAGEVFVEKPLAPTAAEIDTLAQEARAKGTNLVGLDHFAGRFHRSKEEVAGILAQLGGRIERAEFYLLEDHTAFDAGYATEGPAVNEVGAIEREGRASALQNGLTLDLLSHMPPILTYFGTLDMEVKSVEAGRYRGGVGPQEKPAPIKFETYGHVELEFKGDDGKVIPTSARYGKGIRGSTTLGAAFDRDTKALVLHGVNGRRVVVDMRRKGASALTARVIGAGGQEQVIGAKLYAAGYLTLFRQFAQDPGARAELIGLTPQDARDTVDFLERVRERIGPAESIPLYPGAFDEDGLQSDAGARREPPYAEDVDKVLTNGP